MAEVAREVVQKAIEDTLRTIERRASLYRKLVVFVWVWLVLCVAVAIFWRPLATGFGVAALPLLVGCYFALDIAIVRKWLGLTLTNFQNCPEALGSFVMAVQKNQALPQRTVSSMLRHLPADPEGTKRSTDELSKNRPYQQMRRQQYSALVVAAMLSVALKFFVDFGVSGEMRYAFMSTTFFVAIWILRSRLGRRES